ncbi:MAG: metallophosphoesterase [Candidatus Eisenbacteria bacterium]
MVTTEETTARTLHAIVGDVHGELESLLSLEERVHALAAHHGYVPHFVLVGDLVDRGPDSAGVVEHARKGVAAGTHSVILGNHEEAMLAAIDTHAPELLAEAGCALPPTLQTYEASQKYSRSSARLFPDEVFGIYRVLDWLAQGGFATMRSYGSTEPTDLRSWRIPPEHLRFLCGLPLLWTSDDVIVTHAIPDPGALEDQHDTDPDVRRAAITSILWGRRVPKSRVDPSRIHVSGHSPQKGVRRRMRLGMVQVDTGATYGGRLSAWCVELDRVVSALGSQGLR